MRRALNASVSATVLMMAVPTVAQTADQTTVSQMTMSGSRSKMSSSRSIPAAPATPIATNQLDEIIVTAQHRAENLQRAAVAVDVVGGKELASSGVSEPARLQELVPALSVEGTSTGNLIFIRGVGNFTLTPNSDPATAFTYDGVFVARPTSTNGFFFDLDRIEVLKGPQGTLYGRNATAGAINVLPTQPKLGEFSGYGTASYGNFHAHSIEGAVNAPLGADGALRVSGNLVKHDGYDKDGTDDQDIKALRVQLKTRPTSNLTIRLSSDYEGQRGVGAGTSYIYNPVLNPSTGQYVVTPSGLPVDEGNYTPAAQAYRQTLPYPSLGAKAGSLTAYPFQHNDFYGANADIALRATFGTFTIIPGWRYSRLNYLAVPGFFNRDQEKDDQSSVEVRFNGNRISIFDYSLGFYYFRENINAIQVVSAETAASYQDNRYSTDSKAAFGRLTAHLTDRLRLTGGIRYTSDHKDFASTATALQEACVVVIAGQPSCPTAPLLPYTETLAAQPILPTTAAPIPLGRSGALLIRADTPLNSALDNDAITYRGAVEFDLLPRSLFYASVESGYRSGGFNAAIGQPTYAPEHITAYTAGLKNRFFSGKLQLNLEAFLWKYRDQQISHVGIDPVTARPANLTQNIGRSTLKGAEAEMLVLASKTTLLSADLQYLNSKYDSFVYQTPVAAGLPYTACPVSVSSNPSIYNVNCSGFPAYNAPKWTLNLGVQQTIPMGRYKLVASADTQFKSSRFTFFQYQPGQLQQADWHTNAQLTFSPGSERWTISGFVRNLENNRSLVFSPEHPFLNVVEGQYSAPRTYGIRVSSKF